MRAQPAQPLLPLLPRQSDAAVWPLGQSRARPLRHFRVRGRRLCPTHVALRRRKNTAADLVLLDRLEQRLEISLAEAVVALSLDEFEEDRADHGLGEDLQ